MKPYDVQSCRVRWIREIAPATFDMTVQADRPATDALPGQFVQILVPGKPLRRPISVCDCDAAAGTVRLVFQIRGEGTRWLAGLRQGEAVDLLGPLGHGFELGDNRRRAVFVGGGIGVPPLLYAARAFGDRAEAVLGFRTASAQILTRDFQEAGCRVSVCTDDGTAGRHGVVTGRLEELLQEKEAEVVFACGPSPMLRSVAAAASRAGVECQVSLEERMGCGLGACLVCACKTNRADAMGGYSHVCKDGPVFRAEEVEWE